MKALKVWVHGIAQFLLIATIVVFSVPAILTVINWILPVPAGSLGNDFQRMLASLSVLCYGASMVPMLPTLLIVLTTVLSVFDVCWRKVRGHRINKKQLALTLVALVIGVVGLISLEYITAVHTAAPVVF